jgi:hypothetical protein
VSLDDRLQQINQSLRLFHEGKINWMLPVEEVCGSKGLIDKYQSSFYLAFLVIIHRALDFPQGHVKGSWSLRRGGVLMEISQMILIEWGMWSEYWWT